MAKEKPKLWQARLHEIIYESNTGAGKAFDITLLILIFARILVVMVDSVDKFHKFYGKVFYVLEWIFTIMFTHRIFASLNMYKKAVTVCF